MAGAPIHVNRNNEEMKMKCSNICYQYTIRNYESVYQTMANDEKIVSEVFSVGPLNQEVVFELQIIPKSGLYIEVKLHRVTQKLPEIFVMKTKVGIVIQNGYSVKFHTLPDTQIMDTDEEGIVTSKGNWIKSFDENMKNYLWNGALTIIVRGYVKYKSGQPVSTVARITKMTMFSNHIGSLFNNQEYSDVQFIVKDKKFPAHKCILSSRSQVFAAMFRNKLATENHDNIVNIVDIPEDIFEEVLKFIYTDHCPLIEKKASDLIYAADKYNLESLRSLCIETMTQTISVDNACDYLIKADLHAADELYKKVMTFIKKNLNFVLKSDGWKLVNPYPEMMSKILESIASASTSE